MNEPLGNPCDAAVKKETVHPWDNSRVLQESPPILKERNIYEKITYITSELEVLVKEKPVDEPLDTKIVVKEEPVDESLDSEIDVVVKEEPVDEAPLDSEMDVLVKEESSVNRMAPIKKARKKKSVKKAVKRTFFKYDEDQLVQAYSAVELGVSIRKAARDFNVPYSTLNRKVRGDFSLNRRMGRTAVLTTDEEQLLCNYIIANANKGIALNRHTLIETVQDIVTEDKRKTPFTDSKPGRAWLRSFMNRHPEITERNAETINKARAAGTEDNFRYWCKDLENFLEGKGCSDILLDPNRIFNADETGFRTSPKTGQVLGLIDDSNLYDVGSGNGKECMTVLTNFSASGKVVPPMIVFKLQKIRHEITNAIGTDWHIGKTAKGWMTAEQYSDYLEHCFLPWIRKQDIKFPILLLVDGTRSHCTYNVCKLCSDNGIIQYAFYPNATHIMEPAAVSVFKPLQSSWEKVVSDWNRETHGKTITKPVFGKLLGTVFAENLTEDRIRNGFRKCGLYPFDPNAIDFSKCMNHSSRANLPVNINNDKTKPIRWEVEHLLCLESLMKRGRAEEFRHSESAGSWAGDIEATELFDLWRKIRSITMEQEVITPPAHLHQIIERETPNLKDVTTICVPEEATEHPQDQGVENTPRCIQERNVEKTNTQTEYSGIEQKEIRVSSAFLNNITWPTDSPAKRSLKRPARQSLALTAKEVLQYDLDKPNTKRKLEETKKQRQENKIINAISLCYFFVLLSDR
uniref:Jerky protein homolog-like n=1 Tax=Cacopsylla melanoneura TaxID=428564 RepID=A0A8D8SPD9_9HEMI